MSDEAEADATLGRPASPTELFFAFNRLALQGFGGVLAIAQVELVERRRWLTRLQFVEMLSVSQVLPGPNIVNLSLTLGDQFFGWRGAAAALAGLLVVPTAMVLGLTALYAHFSQWAMVSGALRGMGVVAGGLIFATGFKLAGALRANPLGLPLCAALAVLTFAAVAGMRWPLVAVIGGLGPVAVACAWRALRR